MWNDMGSFLSERCKSRNLSWREASLGAGLDHGAISRFIGGTKPSTDSCIKLARYFGVADDIVLHLAGYLDREQGALDPEVEAIARKIGEVPANRRDKVMNAILSILDLHNV